MQRMGFEVAPIHTVQFSNHTGYGDWKGQVFESSLIQDCLQGLKDRDVLKDMQAIISGYLGSPETANVIAKAAQDIKLANPQSIYCADPVMGDFGRGIYVHKDIPDVIKSEIIPKADLLTPNHFETEMLTGAEIIDETSALKAMEKLQDMGAKTIALTSYIPNKNEDDKIRVIIKNQTEAWLFEAPKVKLAKDPVGTGDCFAALLLTHSLKGHSIHEALELTATGLWDILDYTHKLKSWEIQTVAAQDLFVNPKLRFVMKKII